MALIEESFQFDESYTVVFNTSVNPHVPNLIAAVGAFNAGLSIGNKIPLQVPTIEIENNIEAVPDVSQENYIKTLEEENRSLEGRMSASMQPLIQANSNLNNRINRLEGIADRRRKALEVMSKSLVNKSLELAEVEKRVAITSALNRSLITQNRNIIKQDEYRIALAEKDAIIKKLLSKNLLIGVKEAQTMIPSKLPSEVIKEIESETKFKQSTLKNISAIRLLRRGI